ncbi:hypothetical protein BX286_0332 [Streptomyces sp. 3211.6]|uniref:hypothetical protein n=1 Tax=Streptomyces sp. 3211.6 TaxID=1938845 RepID=UPI000EAF0F4E|nr:hypothetical protein [Streptomyces sp. 3211.6]RKT02431.1 hypothetical protein BX286_0332 [Streptomyces sp. 3211.6]
MALKISWLNRTAARAGLAVAYWFPEEAGGTEPPVLDGLGTSRLSRTGVRVDGDPRELAAWNAAALVYLRELLPAVEELERVEDRVRPWRRRLVGRRWAQAAYGRAEEAFLDRMGPAAAAYRPVREAVERRIAEQEAQRAEAGRRAYREQQRRLEEARARFEEWEWRQAAADRPLPGGSTPRELAVRGETPPAWPAELRETVGDVDAWWRRVHASVRNGRAREEAVRTVVEAITAAGAALEAAGRPGISAVKDRPHETRHGWWVHFDWSGLPEPTWLRTPPGMPTGHLYAGQWRDNDFHPARMLLVPGPAYGLSLVSSESVANGMATLYKWRDWESDRFARALVPDRLAHHTSHTSEVAVRLPLADHADPAVYVPYAETVARRAAEAFRAVVTDAAG